MIGSTAGNARHLHLTRAARNAGEAFAFMDMEQDEARRLFPMSLVWAFLGVVAGGALYFGF